MLPQEPYNKIFAISAYIAIGLGIAYLIFNYLLFALLPFLIAYLFAECFKPIMVYSETHKSFPKKSFVLFVILLASFSIAGLIYALVRRVGIEISELAARLSDTITRINKDEQYASQVIDKLNSMVPFVDVRGRLWEMRANLDEELWGAAMGLGDKMSGSLVTAIKSVAAFLPKLIFGFIVTILATYYFTIDRVRVNCFFLSLFPKDIQPRLIKAKELFAESVGKYLRAYGILFCITFVELLIAFMVLRVGYSFVLALVIALVDILPVLGTGAVLVPWGVVSLIIGNYGRGVGILVAYAIITVVRQVIEPKIVGKFIGLSPLAALASMYIGLKLMGIVGIFGFPLLTILGKRILESRKCEKNCEKM